MSDWAEPGEARYRLLNEDGEVVSEGSLEDATAEVDDDPLNDPICVEVPFARRGDPTVTHIWVCIQDDGGDRLYRCEGCGAEQVRYSDAE